MLLLPLVATCWGIWGYYLIGGLFGLGAVGMVCLAAGLLAGGGGVKLGEGIGLWGRAGGAVYWRIGFSIGFAGGGWLISIISSCFGGVVVSCLGSSGCFISCYLGVSSTVLGCSDGKSIGNCAVGGGSTALLDNLVGGGGVFPVFLIGFGGWSGGFLTISINCSFSFCWIGSEFSCCC